MQVRFATLADTADISAIHCSDVEQWYQVSFDEDGKRNRTPARWEECSLISRWQMGGPWMSPELCAVHLNDMLTSDQIVLVAEENGRVIGELEIVLGDDADYGLNANLSVFYVLKEARGHGIGTALLRDAIELVREIGCDTLTTYNPDIPAYYQREGIVYTSTLKQVVVPTSVYPLSKPPRQVKLPQFSQLADMPMLSGRIQSSYQTYSLLHSEAAPGFYAIPGAWRPESYSFAVGTNAKRSIVVLRDPSSSGSWATVHVWAEDWCSELIPAILTRGKRLGFDVLHFVVKEEDIERFAAYDPVSTSDSTVIHCMDLL